MNTHVDKTPQQKMLSASNTVSQRKSQNEAGFQFIDNRPKAIEQQNLQTITDNRPQTKKALQLQTLADKYVSQQKPIQKKRNNTGLPNNLKVGIENLSGISLDDVKVHYNSAKPAQLQAHAYAQGTNIHISAGQEKHLPHEAWHVVQQKQGRVKPTKQLKGNVQVNDDLNLEKEADIMGAKALQTKSKVRNNTNIPLNDNTIVQRASIKETLDAADNQWAHTEQNVNQTNSIYGSYDHTLRSLQGTPQEPIGKKGADGVLAWTKNYHNKASAYLQELNTAVTRTQGHRVSVLGTSTTEEPDAFVLKDDGAEAETANIFRKDHIEIKRTEGNLEAVKAITRKAIKQLIARQAPGVRKYIAEIHAPNLVLPFGAFMDVGEWAKGYITDNLSNFKHTGHGLNLVEIKIYYGQNSIPISASKMIPKTG